MWVTMLESEWEKITFVYFLYKFSYGRLFEKGQGELALLYLRKMKII